MHISIFGKSAFTTPGPPVGFAIRGINTHNSGIRWNNLRNPGSVGALQIDDSRQNFS